jgi:hypothetical protein
MKEGSRVIKNKAVAPSAGVTFPPSVPVRKVNESIESVMIQEWWPDSSHRYVPNRKPQAFALIVMEPFAALSHSCR